jgi:outer membrane protein TolC
MAGAQESGPVPVTLDASRESARKLLDEYVRAALAKSPSLESLRARQASAREMVAPAGALPDPMVGVMYQSIGKPWQPMAPMSMVQAEISQPIPGVGKRQARRDAAQAEADTRRVELSATRSRIAAEVRQTFTQIYALDKEEQALESADDLFTVMLGAVSASYVTGGADQEALAKADVERSRLKEQLLDIHVNRAILVARLNRLAARSQDAVVLRLDTLPEVPLEIGSTSNERLENAPELQVQRAVIHAAQRRCDSAEAETRPNFLVGFAGGATTGGDPVIVLRIGMELPIWRSSKQEPMVRAARNDTEAAEADYRAANLKIHEEVAALKGRFKRDQGQIALYREEIIPKSTFALQAARSAYTLGRADFSTVVEDYRLWLDAQIGLAKREADLLATWSELQAILTPVD